MPDREAVKREGPGMFAMRVVMFFILLGWLTLYAIYPPWVGVLSVPFPDGLRWAGFALGLASLGFWAWTQVALGKAWSPQLQLRKEHHLVTTGPYRRIRHPLYTAMLSYGTGLALVTANWVFIVLAVAVIAGLFARIPKEEQMLIEAFGDDYKAYMQRTGRFFPISRETGMTETPHQILSGVAETLLMTLYIRATESQRPDALIKDEKAVALVAQMSSAVPICYDFDRIKQIPLSEANKLVIVLRYREFDRYARDFLARYPEAGVVHIGCGLDSRFERVADRNGQVEWYDLDLPEVIALRRKFIGDEKERYHLLGCSVLDNTWLEAVRAQRHRPYLFLAEGVFQFFEEAQVKSLVLTLRDRFPYAELVFDAYSPFELWLGNLQISRSKLGTRAHWGIWHGQEMEKWGTGIRLLDEWGFFDRPEPRLAYVRWTRHIEAALRTARIYHFQLGKAAS